MKFEPIVPGIKLLRTPFGNYWSGVVLVQDAKNGSVLIDSGSEKRVVDECIVPALKEESLEPSHLAYITCTHCHGDHIGGHKRLSELTNAKIAVYEGSVDKLQNPLLYSKKIRSVFPIDSPSAPSILDGVTPDVKIKEGELLAGRLRLVHTPGHDDDTVCWFDTVTQTLITGDSVQGDGAAGAGLAFYQNLRDYRESMRKLLDLPIQNMVTAHSYLNIDEPVVGANRVREALEKCVETTNRYDDFIRETLENKTQKTIHEIAVDLINYENHKAPNYLFLEMYTVRSHFIEMGKLSDE